MMQKKILFFSFVLLLFAITFFFPVNNNFSAGGNKNGIEVRKFTSKSGNHYRLYLKGKNKIAFTTTRPDKKDSSVLLCIPAAFTRTDIVPDGFFMVNGVAGNADSINHTIGGAIKIWGDSVKIFPTNKAKIFTKGFIDSLSKEKASVFQQIQMIKNFAAENSKSEKKFQSRGIVILSGGEVAVAESEEAITLKVFADDLAEQKNVKDLLYTDMGAWDEGWYRNDKNQAIIIGRDRSRTEKQSNWIIFVK